MVTDNSNFCRFRLSTFLWVRKNTITACCAIIISHFYSSHQLSRLLCQHVFKQVIHILLRLISTLYLSEFFVHEMINGVLLPKKIVTCKTLYITSKTTAKKKCYQLVQELFHRVHISCYFKVHTFQREQIKLSPEGDTRMKSLQTAAAFMFKVIIVYLLHGIN